MSQTKQLTTQSTDTTSTMPLAMRRKVNNLNLDVDGFGSSWKRHWKRFLNGLEEHKSNGSASELFRVRREYGKASKRATESPISNDEATECEQI